MSRTPPQNRPLASLLALFLLVTALGAQDVRPAPLAATQIAWQRTLDDALALARNEKRPLFVAINADGESASDRIVAERYHDPRFVQWTRRFTCVVASPSRHNARDFDDRGRRIPCPRLGEVTCGEHMLLEPLVFDKYLGGERVSPRHALILEDGTKLFDLVYLFDLHDLDKPLEDASRAAPEPALSPALPQTTRDLAAKDAKQRAAQWRDLAAARDNRGRTAFESIVAEIKSESAVLEALGAIAERGDAGAAGILRLCVGRDPPPSAELLRRVIETADTLKAGSALGDIARDRFRLAVPTPGSCGLGTDRALLAILARFDAKSAATRSLLLALQTLGKHDDRRAAAETMAPLLDAPSVLRVSAEIESAGGPVELDLLLALSRAIGAEIPRRSKPKDTRPDDDTIDRELVAADSALAANPDDVASMRRFGLASSSRARRMIEAARGDARLELEDARTWLARASAKQPGDVELLIERARVAYYLGKFDEEEALAIEALGGWPRGDAFPASAMLVANTSRLAEGDERRALLLLDDDARLEALRWLGDGAARQLATRSGRDPAVEIGGIVRGLRALAIVAAGPSADETDWVSLASFLGALGLFREEVAAWQAGVERLPESPALRAGFQRALWNIGRIDLAPAKAAWVAARNPGSATCAWYAGYASMLAAEDARRSGDVERAIDEYARARARFEASQTLDPRMKQSASHYAGISAFGQGFAHLQVGRRSQAADRLVDGLATCPTVGDARDGLDRDLFDLVDGILEWREGSTSEVSAVVLAERLASAEPDNPRGPLAVADSELREGLRADGRSTHTRTSEAGEIERVPSAEGDFYLRRSIAAARIALRVAETDATKRQLAQSLTVQAERLLVRDLDDGVPALLSEAAQLLGETGPAPDADASALREIAKTVRAKLGEARPVFRPGR